MGAMVGFVPPLVSTAAHIEDDGLCGEGNLCDSFIRRHDNSTSRSQDMDLLGHRTENMSLDVAVKCYNIV